MQNEKDSEQRLTTETSGESSYFTPEGLIATANALERLDEREEQCADVIMQEMEIKDEDVPKIRGTVHSFVSDYARKTSDVSDKEFLVKKFSNYPAIWKNGQEMEKAATDIVEMVYEYERNHKELNDHIRSGKRL